MWTGKVGGFVSFLDVPKAGLSLTQRILDLLGLGLVP